MTLAAIELSPDKTKRAFFDPIGQAGAICRDYCFANNLIMRATRDTMLLSPPLVISTSEIDLMLARAKIALDMTAERIGVSLAGREHTI